MNEALLEARVAQTAELLRRGGVVVYPTETFYGVGALASDAAAVARVAVAKGRPEGKPLPLLAADRAQVEAVAVLEGVAARLADALWPGPLTLVLPAREGLAPEIAAGGTVGIRIPGSPVAQRLAALAGGAIVSTSANLAGEPPVSDPAALSPALVARVDGVLDAGPTPGGLPSTVVLVEGSALRLLREGAVPFDDVLKVAGTI